MGKGKINRIKLPEISSAQISVTANETIKGKVVDQNSILGHTSRTPYIRKTGITPVRQRKSPAPSKSQSKKMNAIFFQDQNKDEDTYEPPKTTKVTPRR